jgi:hypothetical protein
MDDCAGVDCPPGLAVRGRRYAPSGGECCQDIGRNSAGFRLGFRTRVPIRTSSVDDVLAPTRLTERIPSLLPQWVRRFDQGKGPAIIAGPSPTHKKEHEGEHDLQSPSPREARVRSEGADLGDSAQESFFPGQRVRWSCGTEPLDHVHLPTSRADSVLRLDQPARHDKFGSAAHSVRRPMK